MSSTERGTPERLLQLATLLLARSKADEVDWTEERPGVFWAKIAGFFAQVESQDADGRHPYLFSIIDRGGHDSLSALSTADEEAFGPFPPQDDWPRVIADLYSEAKRRGSKIQQALDEMLHAAGQEKIPRGDDDIPF